MLLIIEIAKTSPAITICMECRNAIETLWKTLQEQPYQHFVSFSLVALRQIGKHKANTCTFRSRVVYQFNP